MSVRVPLYVVVNDENGSFCDISCPFMKKPCRCSLFEEIIEYSERFGRFSRTDECLELTIEDNGE